MKKFAILLVSILTLLATPVMARDWTYVSGGYGYSDVKTNVTNRRLSADTVWVEGSAALAPWAFVQARLDKGMDADFDTSTLAASVGLNKTLDERTQVYGKLTATAALQNRYAYQNYAWETEAGVRAKVTDRLELRGGAVAANLREASLSRVVWMGHAGAEYALTPSLRLATDARGKDNVFEGRLGLRLHF